MEFLYLSGFTDNTSAARLRAALESLKAIQIEVVSDRGAAKRQEIKLTPFGLELGKLALTMRSVVEARNAEEQRKLGRRR